MRTAMPANPRRSVPLPAVLAGVLAVEILVVWVFAGWLFPGLI